MRLKLNILRWLPACILMAIIFGFSSIPSQEMPNFYSWDIIIKKGAHMLGYGLLSMAYWYGMKLEKHNWWLAFLLAVLYAISDEIHQSMVPGRHPSWVDALIIDGSGAALGLIVATRHRKRILWKVDLS
jgi:VanZ family protein